VPGRNDPQPAVSDDSSSTPAGKGRPTPKRKDAQAANKRPLVNTDRKSARKADAGKARVQRDLELKAMQTGDEKNMPARDRGPQRRFMRDAVDARWNLGEFMIPVAIVLFIVQLMFAKTIVGEIAINVLFLFIVALSFDCLLLWRSVRKRMRAKFGADVPLKGAAFYTVSRSLQIRRSRLPKPQVKHGERPS
jgi:Flp pilus assembly protein TadB